MVGGAAGGPRLPARPHPRRRDRRQVHEGVAKEIEKGKSALFVQYEGNWAALDRVVEQAIADHHAMLFHSTLPADKARALRELVIPAEELGGEEVVSDYEVEVARRGSPGRGAAARRGGPCAGRRPVPAWPGRGRRRRR